MPFFLSGSMVAGVRFGLVEIKSTLIFFHCHCSLLLLNFFVWFVSFLTSTNSIKNWTKISLKWRCWLSAANLLFAKWPHQCHCHKFYFGKFIQFLTFWLETKNEFGIRYFLPMFDLNVHSRLICPTLFTILTHVTILQTATPLIWFDLI